MKGASLTLVRVVRATPESLFAACTEPATLMRWLGPAEWRAVSVEADVRVGGRFFFRMHGPQGTMAAEGLYEVVDPPRLLVHSWRWIESSNGDPPESGLSRVRYEIQPHPDGARLTFTHEGLEDDDSARSHEEGWAEALDKLVAVF